MLYGVPYRSVFMAVLLSVASATAPNAATAAGERRSTLAITYAEGTHSKVDMLGPALRGARLGNADVERKPGRTRVKLHIDALPHPQSYGSFYTTYVLWAIAPEGKAASLAELPPARRHSADVTTPFQTFGLVVTAEPHGAVTLPSPLIVAENAVRADTQGQLRSATLQYSGAVGGPYDSPGAWVAGRDYATPLPLLGARRAVELAQAADAAVHARAELEQAGQKLAALERGFKPNRELPQSLASEAREVMRLAEHARAQSEQAREQARLASERHDARVRLAEAENDAARARETTQQAQAQAARAQADEQTARASAEREQLAAAEARSEAEHARERELEAQTGKLFAQAQADQARLEADAARRDQEQLRQKLYESLAAIIETRREARGLVLSLSDVLFDFDRATIRPEAREKLSKLAGILIAYPGKFRLDFEGHTDALGAPGYNLRLSVERAESVRGYLLLAGVPLERVGGAVGMGPDRPVASNNSPLGRQLNRHVEIVITDLA